MHWGKPDTFGKRVQSFLGLLDARQASPGTGHCPGKHLQLWGVRRVGQSLFPSLPPAAECPAPAGILVQSLRLAVHHAPERKLDRRLSNMR